MARSRPEKKREPKDGDEQLPMPTARQRTTTRVLPMNLRVGDILTDSRGEWRVVRGPQTASGGKEIEVRIELVAQPGTSEIRSWGAHERIAVNRGSE